MNIGRCECPVGSDGSSCFHQYLLWLQQIATNYNFFPKFDEKARQKFAFIAVGTKKSETEKKYYKKYYSILIDLTWTHVWTTTPDMILMFISTNLGLNLNFLQISLTGYWFCFWWFYLILLCHSQHMTIFYNFL